MYKTVSINITTYKYLDLIASQLNRPKSTILSELVLGRLKKLQQKQYEKLKSFNRFEKKLANSIKLPKGTKLDISNLEDDPKAYEDELAR